MSVHATPVPTFLIPEAAPFSAEQRAWLSGFLAAAIAPHAVGATPLAPGDAAGLVQASGPVLASNDDAPWHDPAMPAEERLKLADGKPLAPRLMAAMAQQDCGQCGYNCADYANAIFLDKEERLNLCAPGGKETSRLLKALYAEREKARALARGENPDGDAAHLDVLAALHKFPKVRPHPEAFVDALEPMQPRLYSISSSPKEAAGRLTLTVDAVRYLIGKRVRSGVASTFLAEGVEPGARLKAYIQKAQHFALPADPATPIIMVGPGTGVAPFRAFLHERKAVGAPGKNWLFFGHQRQATDFFYRDELNALKREGLLTRLSLAWSRDGSEKFYVQHRMREVGAELWQWLAQGAHFYVCGDAKRMAKDVEAALIEIVAAHGARSTDEAIAFVNTLKKAGRYQADVY
jgi:ferredoxin-NADP reductase